MTELFKVTDEKLIEEYYLDERVSQSTLKYFLSPEGIKKYTKQKLSGIIPTEAELYYEEKQAFLIGGGADMLFTQGLEVFNKNYFVSDIEIPGDKIKSICHQVVDLITKDGYEKVPDLNAYTNLLEQAIIEHEYYKNWGMPARIKSVIEGGAEYFRVLIESFGKIVIDNATYKTIYEVYEGFEMNILAIVQEHARGHENLEWYLKNDKVRIFTQVPLYDSVYKGLLDVIIYIVNTETTIIVELKSTSYETNMFYEVIRKFRYDLQLGLYTNLLVNYSQLEQTYPIWLINPSHLLTYIVICNIETPKLIQSYKFYDSDDSFFIENLQKSLYGIKDFRFVVFSEKVNPSTELNYTKEVKFKNIMGINDLLSKYQKYCSDFDSLENFDNVLYLNQYNQISELDLDAIFLRVQ